MRIVSLLNLYMTDEQLRNLQDLGEYETIEKCNYYDESFYHAVSNADIIITKKNFLRYDRLYELRNKIIIIPFGKDDFWKFVDADRLRSNNVIIKHFNREYKEAVGEWVIFMIIFLMRRIDRTINTRESNKDKNLQMGRSLYGKKVTILGNGVLGSHIEHLCHAFGMDVEIYRRFDDIKEKTKDADIIVDCLKNEPGKPPILNEEFFNNLKPGVLFISPASNATYDINALKNALESGIIAAIADDAASGPVGSTDGEIYQTLISFKNAFITPHIAWRTDVEAQLSFDKVIEYIRQIKESYGGNIVGENLK